MPLNTDIRQAIVLALQTQGADVVAQLGDVIEQVRQKLEMLSTQFGEGSITADKFLASATRLIAEMRKTDEIIEATTQEIDGLSAATMNTLIPLEKLIVTGLKWQDTLRAQAEAVRAVDVSLEKLIVSGLKFQETLRDIPDPYSKIDVSLNGLIVDGLKFQEILRAEVLSLGQLADSAQRLKSDTIDKLATDAINARKALESTVISTDQLIASAQKIRSDQVQTFYQNTAQLQRAFEATVIPLDALVASAQRLKSDNIQTFYQNTDRLQKSIEATIIPVESLVMSGLRLQDQLRGGGQQFGGFATAAEQAADKSKRFGYAAMNASYLVQDMQYGIGAVANNIGLMSTSLANASPRLNSFITMLGIPGGAVGLGAGIMFAAVAADVLYHNWGTITAAFGQGLPPKLIGDTKELEERLKALDAKTWKTSVDYREIGLARDELKRLSEEEAAHERLKTGKTEEQQERGKIVSEAVIEAGGVDNVARAVASATPVADSEQTARERSEIEDLERRSKTTWADVRAGKPGASAHDALMATELRLLAGKRRQTTLKSLEDTDKQNRDIAAAKMVDRASLGDDTAAAGIREVFEAHPEKFDALGIDPFRLAGGLQNAKDPLAEKRRKAAEESAKKAKAQQDQIDADRKRQDAERDRFQKQVDDAKAKNDDDTNRGLAEIERNHQANKRAAARDAAKAKTERDRDIREAVQAQKSGVDDELSDAALGRFGANQSVGQAAAGLKPALVRRLKGQGVADAIAGDVADEILKDVLEKAANRVREAVRLQGATPRGATQGLLEIDRAKRRNASAANQAAYEKDAERGAGITEAKENEKGQRKAESEQSRMKRMERATLQNLALQEASMGVVGQATLALAQIQHEQEQLRVNLRQLEGQMNGMRTRRPSGLPRAKGGR